MHRTATCLAATGLAMVVAGLTAAPAAGAQKDPSISGGWVKGPAPGSTATEAFVVVENPTMYDFYLLSASSDAADRVELRQAGKESALEEVTVPAYGSLEMDLKGVYLRLVGLKKPLGEGDRISLTLGSDAGVKLQVQVPVRDGK